MENLTKEELLALLTNGDHRVDFDEIKDMGHIGMLDLVVTVPGPNSHDQPKCYYITMGVELTTAVKSPA